MYISSLLIVSVFHYYCNPGIARGNRIGSDSLVSKYMIETFTEIAQEMYFALLINTASTGMGKKKKKPLATSGSACRQFKRN